MRQLVCLSHLPWQSAPTRTQQLLTRLRGAQVLFFEPHVPGGGRGGRDGRRVRADLTVYTLPPVRQEGRGLPFLRARGQARAAAFALAAMERHRFREPLLWATSPAGLFLADALPHRGLVYDCEREWDELPLEWESELAGRADVCFAASPGLAHRLEPCCDNIALIPNGVNHLLFTQSEPALPPGLRPLRGPLLCRVGAVTPDLDLEPLLYAAARRPRWSFLLLGRASPEVERAVGRWKNIRLAGQVPSPDVADYLAACQVCFDLLSRRSRGCDVLPAHAYEYLASGRPVVSMVDHDQVEPFPDVIYTAHTPEEFLSRCEHALHEDPGWVSHRRRGYAHDARWSQRAGEVQRILEAIGLF